MITTRDAADWRAIAKQVNAERGPTTVYQLLASAVIELLDERDEVFSHAKLVVPPTRTT
jgi:hypothetical protein